MCVMIQRLYVVDWYDRQIWRAKITDNEDKRSVPSCLSAIFKVRVLEASSLEWTHLRVEKS